MKFEKIQLEQLVTIGGGGTPSKSNPEYFTGSIPWVSPKDMKSWDITTSQDKITENAIENSSAKLIEPGAVLVVIRSGVLKHSLPVAINRVPVTINQDLKALRCGNRILPEYLARYLQANAGAILSKVRGTTADNIPTESLRQLEIPLPPLSEQKRIADILDRAEGLRSKRRASLALLDELTQSIFLDMFGDPSTNETETLESVCELITDGTHHTPSYSDSGIIFLSSRNVTSGYITWNDVKFIPEALHAELNKRVSPKLNDILLAKNGTTGIAAIVDRDCVFDIYVSLALLRPSNKVLPVYLRQSINSPFCRQQFNSSLKGIGVPNLHLKEIRKTRIPVPPIQLQNEFVRRIKEVESIKKLMQASLTSIDSSFASLQHRAFRGEL